MSRACSYLWMRERLVFLRLLALLRLALLWLLALDFLWLRFFAPPPVFLLTVAQAIRSAVFDERPFFLELFAIFEAMRFCLLL